MKMYIIALLEKWKIVECDSTPKTIKMKMKDMKLVSDKPMIIKFNKN